MQTPLIKVCGMREPQNIQLVELADPDMMGFIFYPQSPRYVGEEPPTYLPDLQRVGVFVNPTPAQVISAMSRYALTALQFHGQESPAFITQLRQILAEFDFSPLIIKALQVPSQGGLPSTAPYRACCHYILFDTATAGHGGSGKTFNWQQLTQYDGDIPFFVSGGISPTHLPQLLAISHPLFAGIDINSGFETAPGVKDPALVADFIQSIRNNTQQPNTHEPHQ